MEKSAAMVSVLFVCPCVSLQDIQKEKSVIHFN